MLAERVGASSSECQRGVTYGEITLGARILPTAGEGSADNGRDGVLAGGAGQLSMSSLGDGAGGRPYEAALVGDMVEDGISDNVLDAVPLDLDRHGFAMVVK